MEKCALKPKTLFSQLNDVIFKQSEIHHNGEQEDMVI